MFQGHLLSRIFFYWAVLFFTLSGCSFLESDELQPPETPPSEETPAPKTEEAKPLEKIPMPPPAEFYRIEPEPELSTLKPGLVVHFFADSFSKGSGFNHHVKSYILEDGSLNMSSEKYADVYQRTHRYRFEGYLKVDVPGVYHITAMRIHQTNGTRQNSYKLNLWLDHQPLHSAIRLAPHRDDVGSTDKENGYRDGRNWHDPSVGDLWRGHNFIDGKSTLAQHIAPVELQPGLYRLTAQTSHGSRGFTQLEWRGPHSENMVPIPAENVFHSREQFPWRRTPRQAAQMGVDFVQRRVINWTRSQNCFGCHVQSQATWGLNIAKENGYYVSSDLYDTLTLFLNQRHNRTEKERHGPNGNRNLPAHGPYDKTENTELAHVHQTMAILDMYNGNTQEAALKELVSASIPKMEEGGFWTQGKPHPPIDQGNFVVTAQIMLAMQRLAERGDAEVIAALVKPLTWMRSASPETTQDWVYQLLALKWCGDESDEPRIQEIRTHLLDSIHESGGWTDVPDGPGPLNISTAQALYALRIAGEPTDSKTFKRGTRFLMKNQTLNGGWQPFYYKNHPGNGAMLAETMWVVIALVGSFGDLGVTVLAPEEGAFVQGTTQLTAHIENHTEGDVSAVRFEVNGTPSGDGTLNEDGNWVLDYDVSDLKDGDHTVTAIVTTTEKEEAHGTSTFITGKGKLAVTVEEGAIALGQVGLILDASCSMRRKMGGDTMMNQAKKVVIQLVDELPQGADVALRVYGHRIKEGQEGDCEDSELLMPFAALDAPAMKAKIAEVEALGTTPIAHAIEKMGEDFAQKEGFKMAVLITDGKEECGGDPALQVQLLLDKGIDVRMDVVGFAIADKKVRADMAAVAEKTAGDFHDAADPDALLERMRAALAIPFEVVDEMGTVVATGKANGEPIEVPVGSFGLRMKGELDQEAGTVEIVVRQTTQVTVQKSRDGLQIAP